MPIQTASNKFLKCHIQAVITQRARLGREVPVGNGVMTMVRPHITPSIRVCVWISFEALTKAPVGSPERCRVSVLLQPLKWLVNAEVHGIELKTLGG